MKKMLMTLLAVVLLSFANQGKRAVAEVHHVVGDDSGWAPSTDLKSWISGRVFRIGDKIWFAYSSAQSGSIMELETVEEFLSCDLTNPIRMYTSELDKVSLDSEGTRYFASANLENCKNGLKVPVKVHPKDHKIETLTADLADGPASPSASFRFTGMSLPLLIGLLIVSYYMAI